MLASVPFFIAILPFLLLSLVVFIIGLWILTMTQEHFDWMDKHWKRPEKK
jgi:hypothetical protein